MNRVVMAVCIRSMRSKYRHICLLLAITGFIFFLSLRNIANDVSFTDADQGLFFNSEIKIREDGDKLVSQEAIFNRRKEQVTKICGSMKYAMPNTTDSRRRFLINEPKKLAMCYVPKTGCTFWKRVFLKLQSNDEPGSLNGDAFEISKLAIHYIYSIERLSKFRSFNKGYEFLSQATRMMFVREPYSRIFSAYVDKFILPDFWQNIGKFTVKTQRANPDALSLECGHDVSFKEYLRRVVAKAELDFPVYGDEHWYPISKLCHPCTFDYDIIGRQETFSVDMHYILSKLGIDDVLPPQLTRENSSIIAMKDSVDLTWQLKASLPKPCSNSSLMVERLWQTFQLQGYIPSDVPFPYRIMPETTMEEIQKVANEVYRKYKPTPEEWQERRRRAMIDAYKVIPDDLLEDIRNTFKYDFLMFGYDPRLTEIYGGR